VISRLATRIARRAKQESGAVLALTGILMTVFIGMAALAIDIGSYYQAQRQAQSAADSAALAALNDLPTSPTTATSDANAYVEQNYPGATATETYNTGSTVITVTVSKATPAFLGRIFGVTSENVSAKAVAGLPPGIAPSALFANDQSCGGEGILIDGAPERITGAVTSNGKLVVKSDPNVFGATTYGGPNHCSVSADTSKNTFLSLAANNTVSPFPFDYRLPALNPPCTSTITGNHSMSTADPAGVWCVSGTITLPSGINLNGYTLKASNFIFGGNGITVTPASTGNGLSLWDTSTTTSLDLNINGFSGNTIFAPDTEVILDSNNITFAGFVEAKDIQLHGGPITVNGTGPPAFGFTGALQG
jgi:hypothetical protein